MSSKSGEDDCGDCRNSNHLLMRQLGPGTLCCGAAVLLPGQMSP